MKPQYEGRSPGRLWYMWQRTKALVSTFRNSSTKPDAKSMGKNTAFSLGCLLTAGYVAANITLFGIPTVVAGVLFAAGSFFGIKSFKDLRYLKKSSPYLNYIRTQENKWVEKQSRPKLGARIKSLFTRAGTVLGYGLAAAGTALATTAALQYAGVISAVALTTALGGVAAAVSLPVMIGIGAAAIPLGIIGGIVCRKATRRLLGIKPAEKKSSPKALSAQNDNKTAVKNQSVTSTFTQSATVKKQETGLSEERLKAAKERQNRKKDGPKL